MLGMKANKTNSCGYACEDSGKVFKSEENMHRYWRIKAHEAFDMIWKWKFKHRNALLSMWYSGDFRSDMYRKLAVHMGMEVKDCHMKLMSKEECLRVIEFSNNWKKEHMFGKIGKRVEVLENEKVKEKKLIEEDYRRRKNLRAKKARSAKRRRKKDL